MTEEIIIKNLCEDSNYFSSVYCNLEKDDFESKSTKNLYKFIGEIYKKYNKSPNVNELMLYVDSKELNINDKVAIRSTLEEIKNLDYNIDGEILLDSTERFIKNKRFSKVLFIGSDVTDGSNTKDTLESVQAMAESVIKLSFKKSLGLDYKKDAMNNFLEYSKVETNGISSNLEIVNTAIGGSYLSGTLTLFSSVSNSGKTCFLVNESANIMRQGKNVAFFTFEEKEIEIRERFDANLMNKKTEEFKLLGTSLNTSFEMLLNEGIGDLKIKAYAPRSASMLNVRSQLDDWKLKENFVPDIIVLDSITIIAPTTKSDSLYSTGKAVSEEAKALGVEYDCPIISAIQLGRNAYSNKDVGMQDISESLATAQVASTMIGVILDEHRPDIRLLSILKSRKVNKSKLKSQNVNIDTDKQKIWDLTDNDKRTYIKSEQKEQIDFLNTAVETADKLADSDEPTSLLDQLLN